MKTLTPEVNILRDVNNNGFLQGYTPPSYDAAASTLTAANADDILYATRRVLLVDEPVWAVYVGEIWYGRDVGTRTQITIACRRPVPRASVTDFKDRIGKRVCKGTLDEVWPAFESYVRML